MTRFIASLFVVLSVLSLPMGAYALDLQDARLEKLVGEGRDGYVIAIGSGSEVTDLVESVNRQRKAEYARIAKEQGQSVSVVAKVASEQIISKLKPGMKYKGPNGNWLER